VVRQSSKKSGDSKTYPQDKYTGEQIVVLEGLDPVRKRPAMYIGSTDIKGVHHCITEVIDNSVDEALAGFADNVWIIIHTDDSVTVADNGRGIPVDKVPKYNTSALEVVMTKLHAGGKFDSRAYKVSGGLHGVGASVVNALSEYMSVLVVRDGSVYEQSYRRGKPDKPVEKIGKWSPDKRETYKQIPSYLSPDKNKSGTISTFLPDKEIFKDTIISDYSTIRKQIKERAFLVPKLYFHLFDERINKEDHFYPEN
jgi:DNA gyrase subunit B